MTNQTIEIQKQLDARPITVLQMRAVILCWLVNMLDGFDLLAIAYTAPAISKAWSIPPETLGIVFSSSLFGMALGSLLLGPMADRFGRRTMILFGVGILGFSTLSTAFISNTASLLGIRFLTGVAIGALLPSLSTLVAEFTPDRWRNLAVGFLHAGYPVGAILGGLIASSLITLHGWQSMFIVGGTLTLVLLPVLWFGLPESLHYLLQLDPSSSKVKVRIRMLQKKLGWALEDQPITNNPASAAHQPRTPVTDALPARLGDLLIYPWRIPSLSLWVSFLLSNLTLYFLLNWIPMVLIHAGLTNKEAIQGGMILNVGGIVGILVLGYLSVRWPLRRLMQLFFLAGAAAVIVLGQAKVSAYGLFWLIAIAGCFSLGGLIANYSLAARLYPPNIRASGLGLAIGAGRLGAILGPMIGGFLISLGWPMSRYFTLLALPLIAVIFILGSIKAPEKNTPGAGF
jgi:benzoate transport